MQRWMDWQCHLHGLQVNLCQKLLFLHQLTHNMTTDCSLNYKSNAWKFQAQTWGEHVVYRNYFCHSEQFLYTTCSTHVLQKEELLTKIYLYQGKYNFSHISQNICQITESRFKEGRIPHIFHFSKNSCQVSVCRFKFGHLTRFRFWPDEGEWLLLVISYSTYVFS